MKRLNKKGGFTLIELLVVIAIIGILSSIVLVSLNSARKKGSDTRVISDVQETRTQLESDYNGSLYPDLYGTASQTSTSATTTTNGPGITNLITVASDAASQGGGLTYIVTTNSTAGSVTVPNVTAYAIYGKLVSSSNYFCIDSTGNTNPSAIAHASSTCPTAGN